MVAFVASVISVAVTPLSSDELPMAPLAIGTAMSTPNTVTISTIRDGSHGALPSRITDQDFRRIVHDDVDLFIRLLAGDFGAKLSTGDLARAAAAAASASDRAKIRPILILLAQNHASPLVREGCLQGLSNDRSNEALHLIRMLAETDESRVIREVASEILEDSWSE